MFKQFNLKNFSLVKVSTSLVVIASLLTSQVVVNNAVAAEEKQKRPTQLVGQSVGKKVQKAFELYSGDEAKGVESDIDGAIVVLLDIDASKDYDKAYVARFIAVMYATKGDNEKEAIKYLKLAIEPDILKLIYKCKPRTIKAL